MIVVVTGATGGIGSAIVNHLAQRGDVVIASGRNTAILDALSETGRVTPVACDLATEPGCAQLADAALEQERIDGLVHCAGVWPHRRTITAEGWETAFAVNHLAPFRLNTLLGQRFDKDGTQVVQVGAGLAVKGTVDPERTPQGTDFGPIKTYINTKLWNALATQQWGLAWTDSTATIHSIHPGVINTGLGSRPGPLGWLLKLVKRRWDTPSTGASGPIALLDGTDTPTGAFLDADAHTEIELPQQDLREEVFERSLAMIGE